MVFLKGEIREKIKEKKEKSTHTGKGVSIGPLTILLTTPMDDFAIKALRLKRN